MNCDYGIVEEEEGNPTSEGDKDFDRKGRRETYTMLGRIRTFLTPVRTSTNPLLEAEWIQLRHIWFHSCLTFLVLLIIIAHSIFSLWITLSGYDLPPRGLEVKVELYYFQFTLFHVLLYLLPVAMILPEWRRWVSPERFEEILLTSTTRGDLLWSFLAPRLVLPLMVMGAIYVPMWPWSRWWLVYFNHDGRAWTSFHFLITINYLITYGLFNAVLIVWLEVRLHRVLVVELIFVLLSLGFDWLGYWFAFPFLDFETGDRVKWILQWPGFLYGLLLAHSTYWFALLMYPIKWALTGWMIYWMTRRIPASRWIRRG